MTIRPGRIAVHIALILYTILALGPIFLILINAFKTRRAIFADPLGLPNGQTWTTIGFDRVFANSDFGLYFFNSLTVTIVSLVLIVLIGAMAAWALTEYRFRGNTILSLYLAIGIMVPTTTTAMFLPVIIGLAAKAKIAPSKLLMPLAFGAILGGSCTLIGTSTNLAVSGAIVRYGQPPFSMFELTTVGVITFAVGMTYMLFVGRLMLPNRGGEESLTEQYHMREYVSELLVLPSSPFVGKTLGEANIGTLLELNVLGIIREDERIINPPPTERIRRRDRLIVEGSITDILRVKEEQGLEIKPDFMLNDVVLEGGNVELFEVMVMRDSDFVGQTLKTLRFRQSYDLTVLAINRHGDTFINKLSDVSLRFGDVLLVQGRRPDVESLVIDREVLLLEDLSRGNFRIEKRKWAITAFLVFLGLSLAKVTVGVEIPLAICVLIGVMLLLATKTIRYAEMYPLIDFRLLVLIACMMSFGVAMEKTGTDQFLATMIQNYFGAYGPEAILAGFFLLTVILTQPMSNQAAALVVLPVAVKAAVGLGLNPRTFIVAVTYAASFSFITPLEPACVLVYTPGRYRFMDFVKIGTVLTIIVFMVSMMLVPIFWPFEPPQ
jgi:di/tricarboxylate transporter